MPITLKNVWLFFIAFPEYEQFNIYVPSFDLNNQINNFILIFKKFESKPFGFLSASEVAISVKRNDWNVHTLSIKQADYLLLYEQNWLKEGTEGIVLKKTAESSK